MISRSLSPWTSLIFSNGMQLLMQDLRKWGGVAHAEVERAAEDRDAAVGFEHDAAQLL